jgi:VanZ family protein
VSELARRGAVALWLPPILYLVAIFVLSSDSTPLLSPPSFPGGDKVMHFSAYAGLGLLLCRAFAGSGLSPGAALALSVITACLYGASDEWHQSFVPHRMADAIDWLADTLGAATGSTIYVRLLALRGRRAQASIR